VNYIFNTVFQLPVALMHHFTSEQLPEDGQVWQKYIEV
jgi:hypothetical protein